MGDGSQTSNYRTTKCRQPDQWADLYYYYGDHADTPVFEVPYIVTCTRDPSIVQTGTLGPDGKKRVTGLIPGPISVMFWPEDDVQARLETDKLRKELKATLDSIVQQIRSESVYQDQVLDEMPWYEQGLVYTGAFMTGVVDGATNFASGIADAGHQLKAIGAEAHDVWKCIQTGNYSELERKAEAAYAAGKSFLNASKEAFQSLILILSDSQCRQMLMAFPEQYWNAHSKTERVRKLAALGTDIVIGIVIAAIGAAAGPGIVAAIGAIAARLLRPIEKLIEILKKLGDLFRKLKLRSKQRGFTNTENKYPWKNPPERQRGLDHESSSSKPGTNRNGETTPSNENTPTRKEPISMVTGEELLTLVDFVIPGPIPLVWERVYRTSNDDNAGMGYGWLHPGTEKLEVTPDRIKYFDAEGRIIDFPTPTIGKFSANEIEDMELYREWESIYFLRRKGKPQLVFRGRHTERKPENSDTLEIIYLSAIEDRQGNSIQFVQSGGLLEKVETSWGRQLRCQRNAQGLLTRIDYQASDSQPIVMAAYQYDEQLDLICAQDQAGIAEYYQYDNHIIRQRTLKSGSNIYFEWDQHNRAARCLRQWVDDGTMYAQFAWNRDGQSVVLTDSLGHQESLRFDAGKLTEQTDQEGNVTQFEYDEIGRLKARIDPQGFRYENYYDQRNNLSSSLDPAGGGYVLLFDDFDNLTEYSDALGNSWQWEYNKRQLMTKAIDPAGNETRYFYSDNGLPEIIVYPTGEKRLLKWNERAELVIMSINDQLSIHFEHDSLGRVTSRSVRDAETGIEQNTAYQYDARGLITQIAYPDGRSVRLDYTASGKLACYTDPASRKTHFLYDGLGTLIEKVDALGQRFHYRYDTERNLITLENEKSERYELAYDKAGRLIAETGFDGRIQHYQYDPSGHLIAHIEGQYDKDDAQQENTIRFIRDPLGKLLQKLCPDLDNTSYVYNRNGQLISAVNKHSTLAYEYDAFGRIIKDRQNQFEIQHQYDIAGNRIQTALPDGTLIHHDYQSNGTLAQVRLNDAVITRHAHDNLGREYWREQGQLVSQSDYDIAGRLIRQQVGNAQNRQLVIERYYAYHTTGNLERIDDLRKGSRQFTYDAIDRLTQIDGYLQEQFEFDPASNLLSQPNQQVKGNRLSFYGDRHFTYDARGNRIEEKRGTGGKLQTRYLYNHQNQLFRVEKEGQIFEYAYDPLGRRIAKTDTFGETEFIWLDDVLLKEKRNHQEKLYLYEPNSFRPLCFVERNQIFYYQLDHLGTPQEMTDYEGNVVWSGRYKGYGALYQCDIELVENNLRQQGQYFDQETGYYYNRFRYYDCEAGRFISQDPIGLFGGNNSYHYVKNPVVWVDPYGLAEFKTVDFAGSPDLYPAGPNQQNIVKIQMQGGRYLDFKEANIAGGYGTTGKSTPDGYTWHHLHDYDPNTNTSTMQLVKTDAHNATIPHQGSVKQFQDYHGVEYDTPEAKVLAKQANAKTGKASSASEGCG